MQRPKVIINCAMSVDGKIALPARVQTRISSEEDMARVHKLRNKCDAVLVGIGTILADDPKLTVKNECVKNPKQPLRVILDSKCRTPVNAQVLSGKAPTIIFTTVGHSKKMKNYTHLKVRATTKFFDGILYVRTKFASGKFRRYTNFTQCTHPVKFVNVEVVECGEKKVDLEKLLMILHRKGVKRLLVEGGETVIWSFLKEGLVDELYVYVGSMIIGGKTSPTMAGGDGIKKLEEAVRLKLKKATRIGDGVLLQYTIIR